MRFILASGSPRRLELLRQIGIEPIVSVSNFSEAVSSSSPSILVKENARGKALDVLKKFSPNDIIIAADTVVVLDNKVLGKPKTKDEAKEMLKALSGKTHEVLTGVTVLFMGKEETAVEKTLVHFRKLSEEEISNYVATGEPMDKAGAYGIQGKGAILIKGTEGCYNNVVGLPLTRIYELFLRLKIILE